MKLEKNPADAFMQTVHAVGSLKRRKKREVRKPKMKPTLILQMCL